MSATMNDSIHNGGHMVDPSASAEVGAPILPNLEELFGADAQFGSESGFSEEELDALFNAMFDVAVDPNTEMPDGDLIPSLDSFPEESDVDLTDLDDSSAEYDATSVDSVDSDVAGDDAGAGLGGSGGMEDLDDLNNALEDNLDDSLDGGLDNELDNELDDALGEDPADHSDSDDLTDYNGF